MGDYRIYKKLRPFLFKRILFAFMGLILMVLVLLAATYCGMQFPEYRLQIILLFAFIGVFVGWKVIRNGEVRYRLAQVAVITDIVKGADSHDINSRYAMRKARSTFKYASILSLFGNIWRHKNFRKVGQYITIITANMVPYVGTCMISWIFAHPEESKLKGACYAVTNYYSNRKVLRLKVFKAFVKEIILVVAAWFVIFGIEWCIFLAVTEFAPGLDALLDKVDDITDTIEIVYLWYFEKSGGYGWNPRDVMAVIALYLAWFVKVFSIRAYQMIGIIREYLAVGEKNPPSDELYNRLMAQMEKGNFKKEKKKRREAGAVSADAETMTEEMTLRDKETEGAVTKSSVTESNVTEN